MLLLVLICMPVAGSVAAAPPAGDAYQCGGEVETGTWALWDSNGRGYARDVLLGQRLLRNGDTYALYDIEITFHNLLAMAARCGRQERMLQFAKDWMPAFSKLEPVPLPNSSRKVLDYSRNAIAEGTLVPASQQGAAWVCRGGSTCNATNRLLGTEVRLVSAQGLGLFVELANRLSRQAGRDTAAEDFISKAGNAAIDQLNRWGDGKAIANWKAATNIKAGDIRDAQSKWFFTDLSLWQIGIYSDLAGLLRQRPALARVPEGEANVVSTDAIKALLALLKARLSYRNVDVPTTGIVLAADLDRGYWRHYKDGRYAGYQGKRPPAACMKTAGGNTIQYDKGAAEAAPIVQDLGWDISHARRLVHVLDALERNRSAMKEVYGLVDADLPPPDLAKRFAAQLLASTWNRNLKAPLFSNWMSGANGWYRVAYDNGTGRCVAGFPPYALTNAFATGGYITWARFYPVLGELGQGIYVASQSGDGDVASFIRTNYPMLASKAGDQPTLVQVIGRLMFWPTLVSQQQVVR